jgi:hypothetical protein
VVRGGWREGRLGLLVALLSGLYPVLSRIRARDILESRAAATASAQAETIRPAPLREVVGFAG